MLVIAVRGYSIARGLPSDEEIAGTRPRESAYAAAVGKSSRTDPGCESRKCQWRGGALALTLVLGCGGSEVPNTPVMPQQPAQPMARPTSTPLPTPALGAANTKTPPIAQLSPSDATCGLDADGRVWRFVVGKMEPEVPSLTGAQRIACGMNHSCVIGADAKVYCWGNNAYGALGDGMEKDRSEPGPVVGLTQVAEISVDYARMCARTTTGDVYCWGDSEFGKAGDGRLPDNVGREKTTPGKAILSGAATLGVGSAHACAVMPDGRVSCWGQNNSGACGFPASKRYVPRPAFVPKLKDVAIVRAGESITCTIDRQGAVACWGTGSTGVLGPKGPKGEYASSSTPVPIPLPGVTVEVAIGASRHACAAHDRRSLLLGPERSRAARRRHDHGAEHPRAREGIARPRNGALARARSKLCAHGRPRFLLGKRSDSTRRELVPR